VSTRTADRSRRRRDVDDRTPVAPLVTKASPPATAVRGPIAVRTGERSDLSRIFGAGNVDDLQAIAPSEI
jgi:hypothetical protein